MPTIAQRQRSSRPPRSTDNVPPGPSPSRAAIARGHDHGTAGVERGERRVAIAGHEPQAAVGGEIGTDHRRAIGAYAVDGQVERGHRADRATPGRRAIVSSSPSSRPRGKIEVSDELARDHVRDPGAGDGAGMLADATERDDHRETDRERTDRQGSPARSRSTRRAREPLLERGEHGERRAGEPGERGQDERYRNATTRSTA